MDKPIVQVVIGVIEHSEYIVVAKQVEDKQQEIQINADNEKDFLLGLWHLPGGKVNEGESLEHAMMREALEEVGAQVSIKRELGIRREEREKAILELHWFYCTTETAEAHPGEDASEATFVPKNEVKGYCAPAVVAQWPESVLEFFQN
jgi:8-oxo-dGTP diphosphatase